ncbi:MAG: YdgA family protein [Legionella sp.]|nr:YdgA family protein [Legionella sp.]
MKKVIGLVALVLIIVLGAYDGMGYLTERKLREEINVLRQANGVNIQVNRYQRGWFSSDALFNWQLHIPAQTIKTNDQIQIIPAKDLNFPLAARIHHGPMMFSKGKLQFGLGALQTVVTLPQEYIASFKQVFSDASVEPQLFVDFFLNYFGTARLRANLPAFNLTTKEGNKHFEWMGGKATTKISSNLNHVKGVLNLQGTSASVDQAKLQGEKAKIRYDLHRTPQGLFLGNVNAFVPSLKITEGNKHLLSLDDFYMDSDADIQAGLFNTKLKLTLKGLGLENKHYGEGKLDLTVSNLNAEALTQLNEKMNLAQQGSEVQRKTAMLSMIAPLSQLFGQGAELNVKEFMFTMPEGPVQGNLHIALPKDAMNNLVEFTKKIQGNGKLTIPAAVMRQWVVSSIQEKMMAPQGSDTKTMMPAMEPSVDPDENARVAAKSTDLTQQVNSLADAQLATLVQNGMLKPVGSNYVLEATLTQGNFTINGKPFDPEMMKF